MNAWTALAFLLAGAWILWRSIRFPVPAAHPELLAFGLIVAANAPGSFAYHGFGGAVALWVHDVAALGIPLFVAVHDLGLLRGWAVPVRLRWSVGCLVAGGLVLGVVPAASVTLAGLATIAAAAGEFLALRGGFRPRIGPPWTAWEVTWLLVAATLVLGSVAFVLGRTGSPLCNPVGWFQLHAAWHLLSAAASAAFAFAGLEHGLVRERDG